jgi:hypothetical protein
MLKWKLKNKMIIQHPSAKLDLNNLGTHNESSKLLWPCLSFQVVPTLVSHFYQDDHLILFYVVAHVKINTYPF